MPDRPLLLAARGLRAFGFGFSAVLPALHLERAGLSPTLIGVTLAVGLAAASLTGLAAASLAGRFGRRRTLAGIGLLMAVSGIDPALGRQPAFLASPGLAGMLGAASHAYGPSAPGD